MKENCKIIQDLLPLYYDEICSVESRNLIESHLQECAECRKSLQIIETDFETILTPNEELEKTIPFKDFKKRILSKNIKIGILSALIVFVIRFGGYYLLVGHTRPMNYETGMFTINPGDDGIVEVIFNGQNFYGMHATERTIIENGEEKTIIYFHVTETLWTRHFEDESEVPLEFSFGHPWSFIENGNEIVVDQDVIAIYYFTGNFRTSTDEELAEGSTLIWER